MDSIVKNFIGMILTVFGIYILASFSFAQMQIMTARHVHAAVVNQVQSSYYTVDVNAINDKIHETFSDWNVTSTVVSSVNNRQDRLITLNYKVVLPILNLEVPGQIDGYAR